MNSKSWLRRPCRADPGDNGACDTYINEAWTRVVLIKALRGSWEAAVGSLDVLHPGFFHRRPRLFAKLISRWKSTPRRDRIRRAFIVIRCSIFPFRCRALTHFLCLDFAVLGLIMDSDSFWFGSWEWMASFCFRLVMVLICWYLSRFYDTSNWKKGCRGECCLYQKEI